MSAVVETASQRLAVVGTGLDQGPIPRGGPADFTSITLASVTRAANEEHRLAAFTACLPQALPHPPARTETGATSPLPATWPSVLVLQRAPRKPGPLPGFPFLEPRRSHCQFHAAPKDRSAPTWLAIDKPVSVALVADGLGCVHALNLCGVTNPGGSNPELVVLGVGQDT